MSKDSNIKKIPKWASETASVTLAEFLCNEINKIESNFNSSGLHGIDYLLRSEERGHRYKLALDMGRKFTVHSRSKRLINHLFKMSMLDDDYRSAYVSDLRYESNTSGAKYYSSEAIGHLISCYRHNPFDTNGGKDFIKSLKFILDDGYDASSQPSVNQGCQRLIFALIYNLGYQLLADNIDLEYIMEQLSPVADAILTFTDLSPEAKEGMKRQVFINLLSHEPEGLEFMNVRAEELQGVPLHAALQNKDEMQSFCYTLAGPLHLFINDESRKCLAEPLAANYFESHGYKIDIQTAMKGFLARDHFVGYLARRSNEDIQYIQNGITGRGPQVQITIALSVALMKPDVLARLDDKAKLAVIDHALRYIGKQFVRNPKEPNLSGCKESIAEVVRKSPDMIPKIIDMLFDNGLLIPKMYEWFGFGLEEMKFVGKRAHAFKGAMLEQDLGM